MIYYLKYNLKFCIVVLKQPIHTKKGADIMQKLTDQEIVELLHKLPNKAEYLKYLQDLEASQSPQNTSPAGDDE